MTLRAAFSVCVEREDNGHWSVIVNDQYGAEYAKTLGPHLDVALEMAVPYMAYMAEPNPFAKLIHDREVAARLTELHTGGDHAA